MPELTKAQMEALRQRQTMDSPNSDFAEKVRKNLIRKGLFQPVDTTVLDASRKPLTPISTTSTPCFE